MNRILREDRFNKYLGILKNNSFDWISIFKQSFRNPFLLLISLSILKEGNIKTEELGCYKNITLF